MGTRARPCSLSLPFDILSEMRVVEEGGPKNLRILDQVERKAITRIYTSTLFAPLIFQKT